MDQENKPKTSSNRKPRSKTDQPNQSYDVKVVDDFDYDSLRKYQDKFGLIWNQPNRNRKCKICCSSFNIKCDHAWQQYARCSSTQCPNYQYNVQIMNELQQNKGVHQKKLFRNCYLLNKCEGACSNNRKCRLLKTGKHVDGESTTIESTVQVKNRRGKRKLNIEFSHDNSSDMSSNQSIYSRVNVEEIAFTNSVWQDSLNHGIVTQMKDDEIQHKQTSDNKILAQTSHQQQQQVQNESITMTGHQVHSLQANNLMTQISEDDSTCDDFLNVTPSTYQSTIDNPINAIDDEIQHKQTSHQQQQQIQNETIAFTGHQVHSLMTQISDDSTCDDFLNVTPSTYQSTIDNPINAIDDEIQHKQTSHQQQQQIQNETIAFTGHQVHSLMTQISDDSTCDDFLDGFFNSNLEENEKLSFASLKSAISGNCLLPQNQRPSTTYQSTLDNPIFAIDQNLLELLQQNSELKQIESEKSRIDDMLNLSSESNYSPSLAKTHKRDLTLNALNSNDFMFFNTE